MILHDWAVFEGKCKMLSHWTYPYKCKKLYTFCFCPHFSWAEIKDLRLYVHKRSISLKYWPQICLNEHFSFAEIIHPPHRCSISRCWFDSMIIAQVCLRLATIKDHSKMCSFSFQELCTDPCNMGPCIIMLQHEVMVVDEWHNNGPQDLITVSQCIQNAINKMHLCSLFSISSACPYHNTTASMSHLIHNADMSKPLTHTTPYTLSTICPVQWKPGFIHEENTSTKCQTPSNLSICLLKSVTTTNCSQVETQMRMMSMQMSFPEMVSDSLCRNYLVMQTDCCSSCPGGWSWRC